MKPVTEHRKFERTVDYLAFEEKSELRHECYLENLTDKFIQYKKPDTFQNYLLVEPEKCLVTVHKKSAANEWQTDTYTSLTDVIDLPALQISIALKDIYKA